MLRLVPTDQTRSEYLTTPRLNESERIEQVYEVGGPVFKNRTWFWAGYSNNTNNTDRTVTWTNNRGFPPTQSFNSKSTDNTYQYNVTHSYSNAMRIRATGINTRTTSGLGLPTIDSATLTSTSNATLFNPRSTIYSAGYNDSYTGSFDWTINDRMYANVTGGYLGYGAGNKGGDYYKGTVRSFSQPNIGLLDVPANLQQLSGFTDHPSNDFNLYNNFSRYSLNSDLTMFRDWKGQHAFKFGVQMERIANQASSGSQFDGVQVPGVGEVYYIANPGKGFGKSPLGAAFPDTPRPERTYDGQDISFKRRYANNWFANASVTISRTYGNYAGLTNSDENGRNSPNVNRSFDGLYMSFNQTGQPSYGRLQSDRPFSFKASGAYRLPWGTQVGVNFVAQSGLLSTTQVTYKGVPVLCSAAATWAARPWSTTPI